LLPNLGLVKVAGDDARNFLQGQFTADLRRITPTQGCLAAWCNPQGRVLFLMQILGLDDGFLLVVPLSDLERLLKRLRLVITTVIQTVRMSVQIYLLKEMSYTPRFTKLP
jgi:folate-binding Fe-S cluster repair protein YgfZ